jgi:hypothetical protein
MAAAKAVFGQALLQACCGRMPVSRHALGVGQEIGRGLAEQVDRLADLVQFGVGAHAGELRRPVAARHAAEGLVVVPEEGQVGHRRTIAAAPPRCPPIE